MIGRCRALLVDGQRCSCELFEHSHDDICTPPDQIESGP